MNTNFDSSCARSDASGRKYKYLAGRAAAGVAPGAAARAGLLALACATAGLSQAAQAQDAAPARTVYFYSGAGQAEAVPGAWGNGEAAKARDVDYESADALQVTTRNLNEGIRFDLAQPLDIAPYLAPGSNGLVRLRVRFASAFGGRGGGYPGQGGGYPGQGGGGYPGQGGGGYPGQGGGYPGQGGPFPGGDEGGGAPVRSGRMELVSPALAKPAAEAKPEDTRSSALPRALGKAQTRALAQASGYAVGGGGGQGDPRGGMGGDSRAGGYGGGQGGYGQGGYGQGGAGMGMMAPMQRTSIERFQLTMVLDRGTMSGGVDFSMQGSRSDDAGWRLLTIPLAGMRATPGASGLVRRVILTTDKEDTWYLGQAALAVDTKKIAVSLRQPKDAPGAQIGEITIEPGKPITLVADVEAGSSDVAVTWNFDAENAGAPMAPAAGPGMMPGGPNEIGMAGPGGDPRMGGGDSRRGGGDPRMVGGDPRMGGGGDPRMAGGGDGMGGAAFGGARVDARGLIATFTYPNEEQDYTVEVTVTDRSGGKKPETAKIHVKVRG